MKQTGKYILILVVVIALWNTIIIKTSEAVCSFSLHELGHTFHVPSYSDMEYRACA